MNSLSKLISEYPSFNKEAGILSDSWKWLSEGTGHNMDRMGNAWNSVWGEAKNNPLETTGSELGGWGGALAGAKLGGIGGAAFGGVGAIPGAILGGLGGYFGGSWLGGQAGDAAEKSLGWENQFQPQTPTQGNVVGTPQFATTSQLQNAQPFPTSLSGFISNNALAADQRGLLDRPMQPAQ